MSESALSMRRPYRAPWHLWLVGVAGVLWNAMGAFDYLMTETRNAAYLAKFPPAQLEWVNSLPSWAIGLWALASWGGVTGSVLLLMRKKLAVHVFLVSLVAMVLSTIHNYGMANASEVFPGTGAKLFTLVIFLVAVGLYLYARAMNKRGLLT